MPSVKKRGNTYRIMVSQGYDVNFQINLGKFIKLQQVNFTIN